MMDGARHQDRHRGKRDFQIHQDNLIARPDDFGRDFLGRILPACLFQATDYVQALREHRRYMAEMKPLHEQYDILLTCGFGPAPRLDAHKTLNFWQRSNAFTPSNVARTPALVLPCGFSRDGLPLGLQLLARPSGDALVLRAGHAYQLATDWRRRHPVLTPGMPQPRLDAKTNEPVMPDIDAATRSHVEKMAQRAGLKLNERQMTNYCSRRHHARSQWPRA
ncbi:MAG: hypothetical protein KIT18_01315 [Burkholderiales bacterium]|nr:hypothetical protein [Burkholderiales bacterium]